MTKFTGLSFIALSLFSCKRDDPPGDYPIPDIAVNLVINTDLPSYYHLKDPGTHVYEPGGYKGILVIHHFDDSYSALDRACSFEPDASCAMIYVDTVSLNLRCGKFNPAREWIPCCGSKFRFNGEVLTPPARYPLKNFRVVKSGSTLFISN